MRYIILLLTFILFSCEKDPLSHIKRLAKSQDPSKKEQAVKAYDKVIKTTLEAYDRSAGLHKDLGHKLLMNNNYEPAIVHLMKSFEIKNNDAAVAYDLAVCNVNLFKIRKTDMFYLTEADKYYNIALNITPKNKGYLYSYAQLLVFGSMDYLKAIEVLNKILYELNTIDIDSYFLLGRAYYMSGDYANANKIYSEMYNYEKKLNKKQRRQLDNFIKQTAKMRQS